MEFNLYVSDSFTINWSDYFLLLFFFGGGGVCLRDTFRDFDKFLEKNRKALCCQRGNQVSKRVERSSRFMLEMQPDSKGEKPFFSPNFTGKDERLYEFRITDTNWCSWNLDLLAILGAGLQWDWDKKVTPPRGKRSQKEMFSAAQKGIIYD